LHAVDLHIAPSPGERGVFDGPQELTAPEYSSYFFFLAATLRFAGAFFFAAVFAFVAFFTMLPSWVRVWWRCLYSTCANRRCCIFEYYSAKKKNIFRVKETCVERRPMSMMRSLSCGAAAGLRAHRPLAPWLSPLFCEIQDVPVKWPFSACEDASLMTVCAPLDSVCPLRSRDKLERWNSGFFCKKIFENFS
jgi:hypothetical protein